MCVFVQQVCFFGLGKYVHEQCDRYATHNLFSIKVGMSLHHSSVRDDDKMQRH